MLREVIESTYVTEHDLTRRFEERLEELTGSEHAIAMSNGTVALYCGLIALGLEPGDEVIVPDLTFIATANAVIMAGGRPVFVDVDPATLCMDVAAAAAAVTERTRGICPVHLYGTSTDMDALADLAERRGLWMLEDAAQGVGVRWRGQHVGTFGQIGVLSFYGNKTITTGEGGVVLTDDEELARICYRLKNHGRDAKGTFVHEHIGFNFSFTEMQAAVGLAQLDKLERIIARKLEIYDRYRAAFSGLTGVGFPEIRPEVAPVHWFTSIMVEEPDRLADHLAEERIQTRRLFYPLHMQGCYRDMNLPVHLTETSAWAYAHGLSLPSSYQMSGDDQDRVIEGVLDFYRSPDSS